SHAPAAVVSSAPPPTFQRPPQPIDEGDEPINIVPTPQNPVVGQYPGASSTPTMMPNGVQQPNGQMPVQPPGMPTTPQTLPRPGLLPPPTPAAPGVPNPYQPRVIRPAGPGGPGRPGGQGL